MGTTTYVLWIPPLICSYVNWEPCRPHICDQSIHEPCHGKEAPYSIFCAVCSRPLFTTNKHHRPCQMCHVCVCLHWGFTAQSTQWGHVERGQFTSHFYWAGFGDFSTQFRKIILRYKKIGYNINVIRQTVCMVVNPITVNNFASLFTCTPAG